MKLFLCAGEASGDLHGANLANALKQMRPDLELIGWGGPKMKAAGVHTLRGLDKLAFMGFVEVAKNITTVLASFRIIKKQLLETKPDAIVLIDFPGFNLKIAKWAHEHGFKVFYFISPTVWAWKADRVHIIRKYVNRLYCILSFEPAFYAKYDVEVTYVGNPLKDNVSAWQPDPKFLESLPETFKTYTAILPGSRYQEIHRILPVMAQTMASMPENKFIVARTSLLPLQLFEDILDQNFPDWRQNVIIITDKTYDVVHFADNAAVTSGTATLETAMIGTPQVVCYLTNPINYRIAKAVANVQFISLVNLIANKPIVTELIQNDLTPQSLKLNLEKISSGGNERAAMLQEYESLNNLIGEAGVSLRLAEDILRRIDNGPL